MRSKKYIIVLLAVFLIISCKKTEPQADAKGPGYWSINQYIYDQWTTYKGSPYTFQRIITLNGKTDSAFVSAYKIDWGSLFKVFMTTDISNPKFIKHYTFTSFTDDITQTINYYYEAIDDNLFTRKLQISADEFTKRIKNIYIETEQSSMTSDKLQRLYYVPLKLIQIQEYEKSSAGTSKELRVEYRFM